MCVWRLITKPYYYMGCCLTVLDGIAGQAIDNSVCNNDLCKA